MTFVPTDQERRSRAGRGLEHLLWSSRLLVLVAVLASLLTAVGSFYMAAVDVGILLIGGAVFLSTPRAHP